MTNTICKCSTKNEYKHSMLQCVKCELQNELKECKTCKINNIKAKTKYFLMKLLIYFI